MTLSAFFAHIAFALTGVRAGKGLSYFRRLLNSLYLL